MNRARFSKQSGFSFLNPRINLTFKHTNLGAQPMFNGKHTKCMGKITNYGLEVGDCIQGIEIINITDNSILLKNGGTWM